MTSCLSKGLFFLLYTIVFVSCGVFSFASQNGTEDIHSSTGAPTLEMVREVIELAVPVHKKMNDINDYREIILPPYSNTRIALSNYSRNAGENVGYALVQLHAFEFNVTLSYNSTIVDGGHLTGQNIGLLLYGDGDLYALNLNPKQPVWVALVLMLYNQSAPVPGGCNLEFPVEVSPILNVTLTSEVIIVDTPAASVAHQFRNGPNGCGKARLQYESYYIQMPAHDFSQRSYFGAIRSLISYANANSSGRQNSLHAPLQINRHEYGRLNGRGMVFVTAVIDPVHRGFSLYVPAHTYSCQPFINEAECYGLNIPLRVFAVILTIFAVVEIVVGWIPSVVKCPICMACMSVLLSIEYLDWLGKPLPPQTIITCLVAMAIVGLLFGVLFSFLAPITGRVICSFLTGYLILQTMFGLIDGNFYNMPNISLYIVLGATLIGLALSIMLPIVLITRSVILGAICMFYTINTIFGAQLDYPLRHSVRRLYVENYRYVHADPSLDGNDAVALATFVFTMVVCLFLRSRYQSDEVQGDYSRIEIPCHGLARRRHDDDEDRIERSTVIAADDTAAYQRFVNEQTVITRWTSGDDDVFESPQTNSRFFRVLRRTARS
ncbi:transmembrane 7 superfamily member 3-like [Anopheles ziemanni]|uniref:transmembrane 7 superfamily member 3-like n=1 Tax=Anopheles coustani TaxID=139045 RepID=UPI002658B4A7|nr:transmembrane 7 superfamily member 3-like [Anopheles coustani]XP_058173660.1 transmembrane 7 superfamily member 3-like [Anopheles ziemanni]